MSDCDTTPQDPCDDGLPPERTYSVKDEDDLFVIDPEDGVDDSSSSADDVDRPTVYTYEQLVDICNRVGMSPEMIDGVIVQLLVQHLSYPDHYLYPQLNDTYWHEDPAQRTINIYDFTTWQGPESIETPAIIYHNLGQHPRRIAIGDQFYHSQRRPEAEGFARQYHGQHRLMCVGHTDGHAELLASELNEWLTMFSPRLVKSLPFYDFQVGPRAGSKSYSELGDKVGVAFTLSYSYLWAWELVPAGPPLKAVSLNVEH